MAMHVTRSDSMAWSPSFQVGIHVIDSQHMRLVAMLNNLHDAVLFGGGQREAIRILGDLISYTQSHFTLEERLMEQHRYPGAAVHRKEHAHLTESAGEFLRRYAGGELECSEQLQEFLRHWLFGHLLGPDKHLGDFLGKQGVK